MLIWLRKKCVRAAAAALPPGFNCSVTNESLLRSHFLFAGGTIWRMMRLCAIGDHRGDGANSSQVTIIQILTVENYIVQIKCNTIN